MVVNTAIRHHDEVAFGRRFFFGGGEALKGNKMLFNGKDKIAITGQESEGIFEFSFRPQNISSPTMTSLLPMVHLPLLSCQSSGILQDGVPNLIMGVILNCGWIRELHLLYCYPPHHHHHIWVEENQ